MNRTSLSMVLGGLLLGSGCAHASFVANFHKNLLSGNNALFVFGAENTTGTITGNDGFSRGFTIDASGVYTESFGNSGREMTSNGAVNNLSVFVDSIDPISGIALNRGPATTDQTNLLDTDGLGKEYIVLSTPGVFGAGSQFSVTATEDNTVVTIKSPIALAGNTANTAFNRTLQKGESLFYESGRGGDVTGTKVSADKDVAVFAGAECTQVPADVVACDHIVAQQFSVDKFDTNFQIVENFGGGANGDLVRILAAEDNTEVFVNGVSQGTINAGQYIQIDGIGDAQITSDKPVTVGQFIRGQGGTRTTGDPAFAIIPSTNQWLDEYAFATPVGSDAFIQNFLNIAIDQGDAASMLLDGVSVDTSGFNPVNGYLVGNIPINPGFGMISANNPFLATSAGFSSFDSYFNPIATSFSTGASPVDPEPPTQNVPVPATWWLFAPLSAGLLVKARRRQLNKS